MPSTSPSIDIFAGGPPALPRAARPGVVPLVADPNEGMPLHAEDIVRAADDDPVKR